MTQPNASIFLAISLFLVATASAARSEPGPFETTLTRSDIRIAAARKSEDAGTRNAKAAKPAAEAPKTPATAEPAPAAKGEADKKGEPVPEGKSEADAKKDAAPDPDAWTAAEIEAAKARCDKILAHIDAVTVPEPPMKKGDCGAAAPVRLMSIGKKPEIVIHPPAVVTCELAEALHDWMQDNVQPLARKHLGAEVVRIENISDYSCRNALGRKTTRLSEHGRANALDIRRFVTAKGQAADLTDDWGITQRELAEIAAAKAAAEKAAAERAAADAAAQKALQAQKHADTKSADTKAAEAKSKSAAAADKSKPPANPPPVASGSQVGMPAAGIARGTIVDGVPKVKVTLPGAGTGKSDLSRNSLGGPKVKTAAKGGGPIPAPAVTAASGPQSPKQKFLHEAHVAACRIFGTVLGPEANAAHRNHFHVDMAERRYRNFCE